MITLYVATSLDSYLADKEHGLEWLEMAGKGGPDEDYGYSSFMKTVDIVVMGRKTYEVCLGFNEWPYKGKETWVLTRKPSLKALHGENFSPFDRDHWVEAGRVKHVYISGGGETARLFLEASLVDKMVLSTLPILLGDGLPLFPSGFPRSVWKLALSESFLSGLIQTTYLKSITKV